MDVKNRNVVLAREGSGVLARVRCENVVGSSEPKSNSTGTNDAG